MSAEDLDSFLVALLGADAKILQQQHPNMEIDGERFGTEILGFN
jgi:hypothetical protein